MASSSSSSPMASALSSQPWDYDVFLSFRGEDVRKNFVDHLYTALEGKGIDTYKDDKRLLQGESIHPSLMNAIEKSQIAVIIFSEHYADSSWCLDELTHIMKCKHTRGQIVMPIFYGVDPCEVRKQIRKYTEAFLKHELENKNKIEYWRKALVEASNLCGWEPKNIANGHEAYAIKEIVDKISLRLEPVTPSANEKLIGIAARMQRLKSELQIGSDGVRMIGIWGVGGGGKTTLASCIYDEIGKKFDGCCFIANVREESSRRGLEKLKKEILSQTGANSMEKRRCSIEKRLHNRKVLIVLDDVDKHEHLDELVGSHTWFGAGSRIVITTRDEQLLKAHEFVVHDMCLLKDDEAIQLFRKHAPKGSIPMEDYEELSKEVVSYAGGLPLALTTLGSSLCGKNIHQWRSSLDRLKEIPPNRIVEKLKISYDGLEKDQKDLFLDIACFFRREKIDRAMEILDASGFHPVAGVEELRQKTLITISNGRFDMHDLVQEMAHYIVRGEHPRNPEKHSRVWKKEDVPIICAMDGMELDKIEAIQVKYSREYQKPQPQTNTLVANKRTCWHVPLLHGLVKIAETLVKYSRKDTAPQTNTIVVQSNTIVANRSNLRYIQWEGQPSNPLLNNFPPRGLCCLILSRSVQDKLWNGSKCDMPSLKIMELCHLYRLIMMPNFDGISCLERFKLFRCYSLEEIHSSLGGLKRLVSLHVEHCPRIKKFPSVTGLPKLETLSFRGSCGLFKLSVLQQKVDSLRHLHLDNSVETQLKKPGELRFFHKYLRKLDLGLCNLGDEDISSAIWELPNLQELDLSENKFSRLDFSLIRTPRLKLLNVSYCRDLVELSDLPPSIVIFIADYCRSLEMFRDILNCKWLWKASFCWVDKLNAADGSILLDSMLKANAIDDHHMSVVLHHRVPKYVNFVDGLFRGRKCRLHLPHDWQKKFCGFLIHVVTDDGYPVIDIIIKHEVDECPSFNLWQESDEALVRRRPNTHVGYVPFSSLRRHTPCLDPTYNAISFVLRHAKNTSKIASIGATLVPRKSEHDSMQTAKLTTECFQDEKYDCRPTFKIQHDSKSSIKITWKPCKDNFQPDVYTI